MLNHQPILDLFPIDHPFRIWHAALRTREQMVHTLVSNMYNEYGKETPLEVQTALVSLKSLFSECEMLTSRMVEELDIKLEDGARVRYEAQLDMKLEEREEKRKE